MALEIRGSFVSVILFARLNNKSNVYKLISYHLPHCIICFAEQLNSSVSHMSYPGQWKQRCFLALSSLETQGWLVGLVSICNNAVLGSPQDSHGTAFKQLPGLVDHFL